MTSVSHPTQLIACPRVPRLDRPKARLPYKLGLSYFVARSPGLTQFLSFQSGRAIFVPKAPNAFPSMPSSCMLQAGTLLYLQTQPHCPPTSVYPGHTHMTTELQ